MGYFSFFMVMFMISTSVRIIEGIINQNPYRVVIEFLLLAIFMVLLSAAGVFTYAGGLV